MSRYRPPQRRGSTYITPEGERRLREELHQLWKVERPQVTNAVHEAAKNGDRSENGDYIYGKRRLREIDSRVRFLNKRLDELKVIERDAGGHQAKSTSAPGSASRTRPASSSAGVLSVRTSSTSPRAG